MKEKNPLKDIFVSRKDNTSNNSKYTPEIKSIDKINDFLNI